MAIVGHKGQGKSALLDCLGLAGGSPRTSEFAFLNSRRFLSSRNNDAAHYAASLTWRDGTNRTVRLAAALEPPSGPVRVEYLPQAFVERVCTAEPQSNEAQEFERELRKVLFSHIPREEKAGTEDFDALLQKKTATLDVKIEESRHQLDGVVSSYLSLIKFAGRHSEATLAAKIDQQRAAVVEAERAVDTAARHLAEHDARPDHAGLIAELRRKTDELEGQREIVLIERQGIDARLAGANSSEMEQEVLAARVEALRTDLADINERLLTSVYEPLRLTPLASPVLVLAAQEDWARRASETRTRVRESLQAARRAVDSRIEDLQREITKLHSDLQQQDAVREAARQRLRSAEARLAALHGSIEIEESLQWLLAVKEQRDSLPDRMRVLRAEMLELSKRIHGALVQQAGQVSEMFAPVSRYVAEHNSLKATGIEVDVVLEIGQGIGRLRDSVDRRRSLRVLTMLDRFPTCSPSDWSSLAAEIEQIIICEVGSPEEPADPSDDFKMGFSAREFLQQLLGLSWIRLRFGLTSDGVGLETMSPGQRGLILLLFYLLIDRGRTPLLLDQPEENLDNDTVAAVVVPALREASKRRQIVVVTHNVNLAIVGDADQVVRCTYRAGRFGVESGPISALKMASHAVTVLEGTKRALSNRWGKFAEVSDDM